MADRAMVVVRHIISLLCFWLPAERRKKIERWLRGREEFRKLQRSDWVLMSWGKSGRTWLRVMLSRAYQLKGHLEANDLLDFDNFKQHDPQLPAVFFTHNNYLRDYTRNQVRPLLPKDTITTSALCSLSNCSTPRSLRSATRISASG